MYGCLLVELPALVLIFRQNYKMTFTQLSSPRNKRIGNKKKSSLPCQFWAWQSPYNIPDNNNRGKFSCEACKKKCKKEAIRLQDKYFHVDCFTCKECKKQLCMDGFYTRDGEHYCADDYQKLFGIKCCSCGKLAEGEVVTALGKTYHQNCFSCTKCGKKFSAGEKVTFAKSASICTACLQLEDASLAAGKASTDKSVEESKKIKPPHQENHSPKAKATPEIPVEIPVQNGDIPAVNQSVLSSAVSDNTMDQSKCNETVTSTRSMSNLPRVFGMPDSRFYNMSYLEKTSTNFKRGPMTISNNKEQPSTHFHRPENFSYANFRKDFLPDKAGYREKRELANLPRRPDGQDRNLIPIERDDWPGPPEPAAAYPELLREKVYRKTSVDATDGNEKRNSRDIDELSKMTDSGTAAVILRDLKKKKSTSPILDPRNSSRTPSAATEPPQKPRYDTPYYKSPSRYLDMLPQRSQSTDNSLMDKSVNDSRPNTSIDRPSYYGFTPSRPGSSVDARHYYYQSADSINGDQPRRPQSSAGVLQSDITPSTKSPVGEYDPNTGLRHSGGFLRSTTLPPGLTGVSFLDHMQLTTVQRLDEPLKIYTYSELKDENAKLLPGIDKDSLERHLSKEEFEAVFQIDRADFYRLPAWKRNDAKIKAGLY